MEAAQGTDLETRKPPTSRKMRILLVVTLVILSIQAWAGDVVNIFFAPSTGVSPFQFSMEGLQQGLASLNSPLLFYHAYEGIFLLALGIAVLALSFKWSRAKSVRIASIIGLFFLFSAALGGFLFVVSGFANGGNSAQMGGSFLGTYAMYFIALYYSK